MTRPGKHYNKIFYPGHHYLGHHNNSDDPCANILCGNNEICVNGCCVCKAGYIRNSYGKCVPDDGSIPSPEPPVRPIAENPILQETFGYIYSENGGVLNYDPVVDQIPIDPPSDPCDGVVCGPNEICSKGICIPDPNYNPCLGVYCDPGYVCVDGVCVRNLTLGAVTQETGDLIYTEENLVLSYE